MGWCTIQGMATRGGYSDQAARSACRSTPTTNDDCMSSTSRLGAHRGPGRKRRGGTARGEHPEAAHLPGPHSGQLPTRRNSRQREQLGYSPWQAQCSDHTPRTEPCLGGSPIQPGRHVWIHLNTADGGHRGADANTHYVGPQEGEVLTAAAPAAAV